ncbi:MAG: nucleotidyltransferase domain-containing protein, partial [Candidatus Bathyarchaeia archaeon]
MWLPRWVGELYASLHVNFGGEAFHYEDALKFSKSASMAKVALAKLKRMGCLYVHRRSYRRRSYRLCDPEVLIHILSGKITNLWMFKQGRYCRLIGRASVEILKKMPDVRSIVVYGSVARGVAREDSDVDMLVIMESAESLGGRLNQLLKIEALGKVKEELDWLY